MRVLMVVLLFGAACHREGSREPTACPAFLSSSAPAETGVRGPIKVSPNGHHFVDGEGKPFFWLGDTAWPLLAEYPLDTAEAYLWNRAAKGFTVVQTVIAWTHGGTGFEKSNTPMANLFGEKPWLDNDPATPNDAYFRHVDEIVRKADQRGLVLVMQPSWGLLRQRGQGPHPQECTPLRPVARCAIPERGQRGVDDGR